MWSRNPMSWKNPASQMYSDRSIANAMMGDAGNPLVPNLQPANNDRVNGWRNLAFKTKQALMHELIHRAQYTKREGFDPRTEHDVIEVIRKFQRSRDEEQQEYLSHSDEVEAHAHDIALELRNSLSSANEIRNVLRNFSKIPQSPDKVPSLSLWVYGKYFKRNPSHPVVKVMLRKTYRYLQHYMEI